jgi:hypothetical protein
MIDSETANRYFSRKFKPRASFWLRRFVELPGHPVVNCPNIKFFSERTALPSAGKSTL